MTDQNYAKSEQLILFARNSLQSTRCFISKILYNKCSISILVVRRWALSHSGK